MDSVLVVGAGPTGLMLANQLARRGLRPRIIDRHDGPALQTRALGVQARTLEIYAHLGIARNAIDLGKPATGAQMWALGKRAARVPLGPAGRDLSAYSYILILGQDDNEKLLGEVLRKQGIEIEWNTELVGLVPGPDAVIARLKGPDGAVREEAASWVAGCDGARSAVRQINQIEFQGAPYEHVFYVADTEMTGSMIPDEVNVYLWPGGFHLFFPLRGTDHWRIVGILPQALRGRDDVTLDDVVPSIHQVAGDSLSFKNCSWFSTYRIHHRRAERFRKGRCFLLGDAAHIHSPVGAQGMNTGLQDAYNLGWKLALVASGAAGAELLDTYEAERIPVASRLLSTTDRFFRFIVSENRLAGAFRTRFLPNFLAFAMKFESAQRAAFRTISQVGISYRDSPLSESPTGAAGSGNGPRPGDRFPWLRLKLSPDGPVRDLFEEVDDTRFTLIAVGQLGPDGPAPKWGGLVRTLAIPSDAENRRVLERAGISSPSFFLLRPDGHIGLSGGRLEAADVSHYLSRRARLSTD